MYIRTYLYMIYIHVFQILPSSSSLNGLRRPGEESTAPFGHEGQPAVARQQQQQPDAWTPQLWDMEKMVV